jgi:RNA polymerase sigma-70 factor (ECF subfamily)
MVANVAIESFHVPQLPPHTSRRDEPTSVAIVRTLLSDRPGGAPLLFDRYEREVNRLVWRLLGTDPDHDDIVQHIFCTIIGRVETLRDADKLDQWVHAVTVNTVYAELRKRQVRRLFLLTQPSEPWQGDLSEDVENRDLLGHATRLLGRLSAKERVVFVLHYVDGHTLGEVAQLCGFSLATAKRRLASADHRFQKMIQREPALTSLLKRRKREAFT